MTGRPLPWPYLNRQGGSLIHVLDDTERCFTIGPIDSIKRGRSALIYLRAIKNSSNTSRFFNYKIEILS